MDELDVWRKINQFDVEMCRKFIPLEASFIQTAVGWLHDWIEVFPTVDF